MKARKRGRRRYTKPGGQTYVFRLFVAGDESNSSQARGNLARLCEEHIKGRYKIETIDVLKDPAAVPPNFIAVAPVRSVPRIVTLAPPAVVSVLGLMLVIVGGGGMKVKPPDFVAVPPRLVTKTSAAPAACAGVNAEMLVSLLTTKLVASTPPNCTPVAPVK